MIVLRDKLFSFRDWLDKVNKKIDPNYKTEKEVIEEERRERERRNKEEEANIDAELSRISPYHSELLRLDKTIGKSYPNFGDGDEYPTFNLYRRKDNKYTPFGTVLLGWHDEPVYIWTNNSYWVDDSGYRPRRVTNLKQDMVKYLQSVLPDYDYKKDKYGWDKEDYEEVTEHIKRLIEGISKSKL